MASAAYVGLLRFFATPCGRNDSDGDDDVAAGMVPHHVRDGPSGLFEGVDSVDDRGHLT